MALAHDVAERGSTPEARPEAASELLRLERLVQMLTARIAADCIRRHTLRDAALRLRCSLTWEDAVSYERVRALRAPDARQENGTR